MTSEFPCPNPSCTHVFPAGSVAGASSLECPRCGTRFHFSASAAVSDAPSPAPGATPQVEPVPVQPSSRSRSEARGAAAGPQAVAPDSAGTAFSLPAEALLARARRVRGRPPWSLRLLRVGVVLAVAGLGVWWLVALAIPWYREQWGSGPNGASSSLVTSKPANCQFTIPASKKWAKDEAVRPFGVATLVGMRRADPNGWLSLAAHDYGRTMPRQAELVDMTVHRLEDSFRNLEWNQRAEAPMGGQRALHLVFQGLANHVLMSGDCYILAYKGIVYWFVVWGPVDSAELSREEWDEARKGFALLKEREGWKENPPEEATFRGTKAGYVLRDTQGGLWKDWPKPADFDPAADMLLQAEDKEDAKGVDRKGRAAVLVLEPAGDLAQAVRNARAHVEKQQKQIYPATTMTVVLAPGGAEDAEAMVGDVKGHLVKLHVKNTAGRERLLWLAVVQQPEHVLVVECECDWRRRSLWEADFKNLLSTFSLNLS